MSNTFDQFDSLNAKNAKLTNTFDQFDSLNTTANTFDQFDSLTTDDRPVAQNWQPSLLESVQGVFGANKERASNELAARRIAEREGVSTNQVYESVGGHQPMLNPEGRNPAVALTEGAKVVAQQAPDIIPSIENTALRAIRGGRDTVVDDSWLDREITATDRPPPEDTDPNYAKLQGLGKSAGYSLTTLGATLGASIPAGMATTPAGGVAAGMAASGAVSFRGSKDEFLDNALKKMNADSMKRNGRPINQAEWDDAQEKLNTAANKYGAWEAIPEAVGNAVLLGTITKGLKGAVLGQASEQATETMTGVGQNRAEYEAGLTNEKIGIDEAWRNQALQTALLAGGMQAAGAGLNATKNALFGKEESKPNQENAESTQNIYADQSSPPPQSGLDMNAVVDRMIGAESAGKADAKNPLSSAEGLGQFIDSTWLKMVKKHRPDIANGKSDQDILDLKTNGALSREMTTRYAEDNMQELQSSGFEATGRNVYLAHHFGAGGARSLLRADPNVPVASVVSAQVIQQNPYMRGKTVGQVLDFIGNKMGEQAGSVSSASVSSATGKPTPSLINNPSQNTTETNTPASTTPANDTPNSLTDEINPTLKVGTETLQAAQAPMDSPTAPSQPEKLSDRVSLLTGKSGRIRSEDGQWHEANYQVVEASDLQSTLDKAANQYRDRTRQGLTDQVQGIAKDLQYDLVAQSPVMEIGSPVLAQDGSVIAGNGRLAGIQQAYQQGKASDYKARLLEDAPNLGIDAAQVQAMQQPVLIRSFKGEIDAQRLATLSNEGGSARMSPLEQAKVDAERIGSLSGFTPDESGNITPASSQQLIKRLVMNTPQNQHNALMDSKGQVSQEGMRRIQNAVLYMSYGDSPALSRLVETTDTDGRNILRALNGAAPALAEMRDNIRQGISHQADIVPELIGAVEVFARLKAKGENIQSWLNQLDAFGDIPNEIKSILLFLDQNSRRPAVIRAMLIDYANLLKGYGAPSQNDLFNAEPPTKQEVLNRAIQASEEQPAADLLSGAGRGGQAGGNRFDQQPQAESATSAGIDAGNQGQGGITSSGADAKASSDIQYSVSGVNDADLSYAAEVLNEFAKYDDLFRYPVSGKYTLSEIMAEVSPNVRYLGEDTRPDESAVSTAEHRYMFQTEKNRNFYVYTRNEGRDGTVWIDVSRLAEGDGGSGIYAAIANYAYNNKMEFIGDPDGLSEAATQRRTQHMLSSFLRYGSIDHFSPSKEQMSGIPEKGIPALAWQGSDVDRLKSLIDVSLATLHNRFPAIKGARYDFTRQQFVDSRGLPFTDADFERIASAGGISQARAGDKTLRRGILLQSLVSGQNRESGILDRVLLRSRKLLSGLSGIFSQQDTTGRTRSGLSVSGVQAELAAKLGDARVKRLQLLGKLVLADNPPADGVQGSYQNGVVTLYSDNIQQGDAWGVFLHEAGEHANLEQMLGAEKHALVVSSFDKLVKSGNADAIRAAERVPANTPEQHVAAERLAYLIEDFTNNTLKTGGAKNLARRLIAALRAWAFAKLPAWARPQELSVADIQALAVRAARAWATSITAETGSNSQAAEKQGAVNELETSGDVLYSFGEKIAKQLYDPDQVVRQQGVVSFVKRMVDGNYGSVHQVIRSINTPTARELADVFEVHADPDVRTNDYYIHDFHTDVSKGIGKYNTQLNAILKPLRKGRLDRVSKADGYALVRGLHTGIVPDHLVDTALALRKFLDELRDYQQAAGLSLDYLRNYFPRMYDVSKVLNQQKAFTEVLEKHGLSKNAARDVINKIVNGDGLLEADKVDDSERITPEEADAAPDTAEDEADSDAAKQGKEKKDKEKNLRRRLSRVNGVEGSAGKAKHQKHRSLHKIPYDDLAPFLNNNLEEILVRYVSAAVRKAEYARRFGEREQQLNQMVAKIVKELQAGERINSGSFADAWKNMGGRTTGEAVRFIYSAADALQGKYKPIENDTARNANTVVSNTITQLLLPLAALSSLVEFATSPIRGQSFRSSSVGLMHGVAYALKRAVDSAGLVVTGRHLIKSEGHYAELAEQLGIVTQDALMERLAEQAAFAGGNNKLANLSNWSTQKFMTYTLQEPIMKMQKVAALATYHRVVRQWAKTTDKPMSVRKLREFGIDPVQAKEWAEGGFKDNSPAMFAINAGSIRFVNSVVTTPTSTNRPLWTQDPHFRLFYQFTTFQKVFTNTLYRYILTNLVNSKVTKVEKLRIVATMALMMGVAMAAQALRDWWKYGDERKEKTGAEWAGIGIDRSGFTGNFAPIYEFFWPYRHGYYDNAAVRAASLFGPAFSTLVKNMDAFSISEKTGKVNAKKAARQLVNDIPYVNALPRKGQLSAPRKALEGAFEEGLK